MVLGRHEAHEMFLWIKAMVSGLPLVHLALGEGVELDTSIQFSAFSQCQCSVMSFFYHSFSRIISTTATLRLQSSFYRHWLNIQGAHVSRKQSRGVYENLSMGFITREPPHCRDVRIIAWYISLLSKHFYLLPHHQSTYSLLWKQVATIAGVKIQIKNKRHGTPWASRRGYLYHPRSLAMLPKYHSRCGRVL